MLSSTEVLLRAKGGNDLHFWKEAAEQGIKTFTETRKTRGGTSVEEKRIEDLDLKQPMSVS